MDLFNTNSKKKALEELEGAQKQYELTGRRASDAVQSLYKKRKEAVIAIESAEKILKKQPDFGTENIKKVADARASIRLFTEALLNEKSSLNINESTGKYASAAMAGTAAGAAVATLGPTAAMAFATTFGSAATGTAISTLSGAAATNAALAWLGGGALAVGGGGMAAGSTILAMAGPIGLAIGTVSVGFAGFKAAKKNSEIAKNANDMTKQIKQKIEKLNTSITQICNLGTIISEDTKTLRHLIEEPSNDNGTTYNYTEIVAIIIGLCHNINIKFTI
jgi:hypothetical protein